MNTPTALIITLLLALLAPVDVTDAKQPNVLFIITDDQGYGDFSIHGITLPPLLERTDNSAWPERTLFKHNPMDKTKQVPRRRAQSTLSPDSRNQGASGRI